MPPPPSFPNRPALSRPATAVAPELLGCRLVSDVGGERVVVRLTEVEAYDGADDPGSHAYRGKTARNAVMFGPPGHAYVYFVYGMHWCVNLVCGPAGTASAILLRAGEVVTGAEAAARRRPACRFPRELASGPARLASALGIDAAVNGADLLTRRSTPSGGDFRGTWSGGRSGAEAAAGWLTGTGPLTLHPAQDAGPPDVSSGPRVGVGGDGATFPWRYWITGDPTVSTYRAHQPRRRPGDGKA